MPTLFEGSSDDAAQVIRRDLDAAERRRRAFIAASAGISVVSLVLIAAFGVMAFLGPDVGRAGADAIGTIPGTRDTGLEITWAVPAPVPRPSQAPTVQPGTVASSTTDTEQKLSPKAAPQRVFVNIGAYGYEPEFVRVRAGVPIEITVGRGDGCAAGFVIPGLDVSLDNSQGPATVTLPPLKEGTYRFACGMDMIAGELVAQ